MILRTAASIIILLSLSCSEVNLQEINPNDTEPKDKTFSDYLKLDENTFRIKVYSKNDIENFSFSVTDSPKFNKVEDVSMTFEKMYYPFWFSYEDCSEIYKFKLRSKESATKYVADWFKDSVKEGTSACMMNFNYDINPKKLNFAIKGDFSFEYKGEKIDFKNIIIGQGQSMGLIKNWWIGSEGFEKVEIQGPHKGMRDFLLGKKIQTEKHGEIFVYFHMDDDLKSNLVEFGIR